MSEVKHKWQRVPGNMQPIYVCVRCNLRRMRSGRSPTALKYAMPATPAIFAAMRPVPECDPRPKSERR